MDGPRSTLGALVVGALLVSSIASADPRTACDRALLLDGPPQAVSALRAALHEGALGTSADATCAGAVASLREREGGYTIALTVGSAHVERDVATLSAAATWLTAWLTGSVPDGGDAEPAVAVPPAPPIAPRTTRPKPDPIVPSAPPPRVIFVEPVVQIALVGTGAAASDGSVWGGGELSAQLHVTSALWLGAALGFEGDTTWTGPAAENDETSRLALRAAAKAGARMPLSPRIEGILGGGLGVTWGTALRQFPSEEEDLQQGGFFLEAHADASVRLSRRLSLLGGVATRARFLSGRATDHETEAQMPDPLPALTGELRLGASWDIGGTP